jgi:hypothetical protein
MTVDSHPYKGHARWNAVRLRVPGPRLDRYEGIPVGLEDDPGFGHPDYPRHAIGYIPEDQRPVRMCHSSPDSGVIITSPVEKRLVQSKLEDGWWLANENRTKPVSDQQPEQ